MDAQPKDWKEKVPLVHFTAIYKTLNAEEISARCNIPFDAAQSAFSLRLMGVSHKIAFPDFEMRDENENIVRESDVKVLVLRFLCEGRWTKYAGKQLSYREIPWGELYFKNFEGRCIKRVERTFGNRINDFCAIFDRHKNLQAEKLAGKQSGFRFEFLSGLFMSIIIWEGDDEFPSKAQILFDDNFPAAFSAEDTAYAGDVCINALKNYAAGETSPLPSANTAIDPSGKPSDKR